MTKTPHECCVSQDDRKLLERTETCEQNVPFHREMTRAVIEYRQRSRVSHAYAVRHFQTFSCLPGGHRVNCTAGTTPRKIRFGTRQDRPLKYTQHEQAFRMHSNASLLPIESQSRDVVLRQTDDESRPDDPTIPTDEMKEARGSTRYTKYIVSIVFVGLIIFIILDSTIGNKVIRDGVTSFLEWIEENPGPGVFAFILVYFGATVLFIPGSILTLGAGFVFANAFGLGLGLLLGTLAVFVGASSGAMVSFLLARYLFRDCMGWLTKKYVVFAALDSALADKGYRIMTLLRLSPIIPFNALNYVAGVTAISFMQYTLALFAILPGSILYVFLGASAGSLTDSATSGNDDLTVTYISVAVGVVFGVSAVAMTSYYAKQELNKLTRQNQESSDDQDSDSEAGIDM